MYYICICLQLPKTSENSELNTKVEGRILRSFSNGQEEMDDQENDTHSEVAREDRRDPWSEDEAKERSNILQLWGYTGW